MELLDEVKKVLDKYDLEVKLPDCCKTNFYDCKCEEGTFGGYPKAFDPKNGDGYLFDKYQDYIPQGWYGFALGKPTPKAWCDAIEEVLDLLIKFDPNLQIHQIKTKYGGIRFYVHSEVIEDIYKIENEMESRMWSKLLMY